MADIKEVVKVNKANTNTSMVFRVTIPKAIAAAAELEMGQQLVVSWDEKNKQIILKKF